MNSETKLALKARLAAINFEQGKLRDDLTAAQKLVDKSLARVAKLHTEIKALDREREKINEDMK